MRLNLKLAAALIALPIGVLSLLPKPVTASETPLPPSIPRLSAVTMPSGPPHADHGRERAAARREVIRYEEARRAVQRKLWLAATGKAVYQESLTETL